jgi:methionyl aminopeptidase
MNKVGRNDPCPCGSNKKYKRCHGKGTASGEELFLPGPGLEIKTSEDIIGMKKAGVLAASILHEACARVELGTTTAQINGWVHDLTLDAGAYPSPLNYPAAPTDPRNPVIARRAFPASVCTSVNEVVCHGIPDDRALEDGDIVNVDVTCTLDGYFGDTSRTLKIGSVSEDAHKVTDTARECLEAGIALCKDGALFWEIGDAIQTLAEGRGLSVVRDFTGHGIGRTFHEPPAVLHYRDRTMRYAMRAGNIFTIEPMVNIGTHHVTISREDHWTARTEDGQLTAQFEHTILITETGHEVLTAPPA